MPLNKNIQTFPRKAENEQVSFTRREVEISIDTALPSALIALLDKDGHSIGFDKLVEIEPVEDHPLLSNDRRQPVFTIFGLNSGADGIIAQYQRLKGRIHINAIPIGDDGLDNAFVFDPVSGHVLFWHHECQDGEGSPTALSLVSRSMDDFINGLVPGAEPDSAELKRGVKKVRLDF